MKHNPKVSVIIPCFNTARYLASSINSVLNQSIQDFEIILVDDGSTDHLVEVVSQLNTDIHFISQENKGPGAARNAGISKSTGEYLVFLDADDVLLPEKLKVQSDYLDNQPDVGVVFSKVYGFQDKSGSNEEVWQYPVSMRLLRSLGTPKNNLEVFVIQNLLPPVAAMVRRECVLDIGGFDESRELSSLEDWDLWFRLAGRYNFAFLDQFVAKYRFTSNSLSNNRQQVKKASRVMENRIVNSESFDNLSDAAKSRVFFYWGVNWLDFREPELALDHFSYALQYNSYNILARSAQLLTSLMGEKAVIFYRLKRKIIGC